MIRGVVPHCCCWWLVRLLCVLGSAGLPAADVPHQDRPRQWVRELAAPMFAVRQRATQHLIECGIPALSAVEAGLRSRDREVRLRCQRIRQVIAENDFQARLDRFATDAHSDRDYGLPKWKAFRGLAGDSAASRQLFVEMQREQGTFLDALQRHPETAPQLIDAGVRILRGTHVEHYRKPHSLATLATMLLLVLDRDITERSINEPLTLYLFRLDTSLRDSPVREPLIALLRRWLPRLEGPSTYMAMHISLRHDIAEGRVLAERALRATTRPDDGLREQRNGRTYWRHLAVVMLARFGDERHVVLLTPLLEDSTPTPYARRHGTARDVTEIRDIALATLITLRRRDLREFGFRNVRRDRAQVWDLRTLAFASDADRDRAITAWRLLESKTP